MKKNYLLSYYTLVLSILLITTHANAQQGKGLVFDGTSQVVQFPSTGFPVGTSARTLAFWVRALPNTDGSPHHIINWGQIGAQGSTFGVFARYINGQYNLAFWGHNRDIQPIGTLPDDQWHFVSLTYDGSTLRSFVDGELKSNKSISLNTNPGPMYVGSRSDRSGFFSGAVRDIAVWNTVRNQNQIQMDMASWPTLTGNETGLVAYLPLNEGKGNTFSDIKNVIKGTIDGKATWSKPIPANPDPIDEGIWFVIQNKADLDNDTDLAARRMALSANGSSVTWAAIPLNGDYDAFLWRAIPEKGRYRLINKKMGMTKALDTYQGKRYVFLANYGNYSGQFWIVQQANVNNWGTNTYTLSNDYVTASEALTFDGKEIRFMAKQEGQTNQAWVLQPMELAVGYHIPVSDAKVFPMSQQLEMANGFKLNATGTTSEWAVLNGHLILKNMLNNLSNDSRNTRARDANSNYKRQIIMISRYDQNRFAWEYPLMQMDPKYPWNEKDLAELRGGVRDQTLVTEEMMCRRGVFSRGYLDRAYREFDQVVHEFGHTLDHLSGIDGGTFPEPLLGGSKAEAEASAVQSWYNNNYSYKDRARRRTELKSKQLSQYDRLKEFFRESNSWLPPRWLRDQPDGRVELKDGETLQAGEWIYSTTPYSPNGAYAVLQDDGNFVVYTNDGNSFKWGSYNNLSVALSKVKSLQMENGILRMKDASGNNVYSSSNTGSPGARLVIAEPLPGKPNSWIRILAANGDLVWNP